MGVGGQGSPPNISHQGWVGPGSGTPSVGGVPAHEISSEVLPAQSTLSLMILCVNCRVQMAAAPSTLSPKGCGSDLQGQVMRSIPEVESAETIIWLTKRQKVRFQHRFPFLKAGFGPQGRQHCLGFLLTLPQEKLLRPCVTQSFCRDFPFQGSAQHWIFQDL